MTLRNEHRFSCFMSVFMILSDGNIEDKATFCEHIAVERKPVSRCFLLLTDPITTHRTDKDTFVVVLVMNGLPQQ